MGSFDINAEKKSSTDEDFDEMNQKPREPSSSLPVQLILEHRLHKTMSIFNTEIPIFNDVGILKEDMGKLLGLRPDQQDWWFKGKQLQDTDVLGHMAIRRDDKITVREISSKLSVEGENTEAKSVQEELQT